MKTYGLVLADNGSPWFFQGEQNPTGPRAARGAEAHPGLGVRGGGHLVADDLGQQHGGETAALKPVMITPLQTDTLEAFSSGCA